jgi:hypothetical protein
MKACLLVILFALLIVLGGGLPALAQNNNPLNAGFVSGLWYSQIPFFAGDKIRIYTAIQNRSGFDITGKVQFFNQAQVIGEADFSALNGRLIEVWTDWTASEGNHRLWAKITEAKKSEIGQEPEAISLIFDSSPPNEVFVDLDTDGDQIGNQQDLDDDNDGLSDEAELAQGSDPLSADSDGDGLIDGKDPEPLETQTGSGAVSSGETDTFGRLKKTIRSVTGEVNRWADQLKGKIEPQKEQLEQELADLQATGKNRAKEAVITSEAGKSNSKDQIIKLGKSESEEPLIQRTTTKRIYLAALSGVSFILERKLLLYSVLLLLLLFLFKLIVRFIKGY